MANGTNSKATPLLSVSSICEQLANARGFARCIEARSAARYTAFDKVKGDNSLRPEVIRPGHGGAARTGL